MCTKVGLSADETQALISKTKDQEIKDTLKETTQKALDLGVSTLTNRWDYVVTNKIISIDFVQSLCKLAAVKDY